MWATRRMTGLARFERLLPAGIVKPENASDPTAAVYKLPDTSEGVQKGLYLQLRGRCGREGGRRLIHPSSAPNISS